MQVTIEESFQVEEPVDKVWNYLSDLQKVVVCVQGASITEIIDERNFKGMVSVKIGPILSKYNGDGKIEKLDNEAREIEITGHGVDSKGQGNASMKMIGSVKSLDTNLSEISSSMELTMSGKVAQLGSRMIKAVNKQMFNQFKKNLITNLQSEEEVEITDDEPEPIKAISLFFVVTFLAIISPFRRFFGWIKRKITGADKDK